MSKNISSASRVLVLKLSEGADLPPQRLAQLADGHWKVNAVNIQSVNFVIVLVHMKVVGDFYLGDRLTLEVNTGRISDLGLEDAENATGLVGKTINYRTANPATIKEFGDLENLVV